MRQVFRRGKKYLWFQNVFYNAATPSEKDKELHHAPGYNPEFRLVQEGGHTFLHLTFNSIYSTHQVKLINTATLRKAKFSKGSFETPDGYLIVFDRDYYGKKTR